MNKKLLLIAVIVAALFNSCKDKEMSNPILAESGNPYGAPAFDKITEDDYLPAFKIALEEAKADIAQEKAAAISEIRAQVAELSVKVAEKILRKELDSSENQMETIDRLLDEVSVK